MKKKILALLGFVSIFGLAACKDNKTKQFSEVETKGDWGAAEVKENIEKDEEEAVVNKVNYKVSSDISFSAKDIYDASYANKGLLVIKNSSNHIGFYSLLHDKYLIERQFIEEVVTYSVEANAQLGFVLRIVYDDYAYYYDSLGNLLFVDELNSGNVNIQTTLVNKKVYASVSGYVDEYYKTTIYEYQTDGSLKEVSLVPEEIDVVDNTKKTPFSKNSQYVDLNKTDLEEFGLKGYYLSVKNELVTVFETSSNEPKSTFTVPQGSTMMLVKNKLFYQNTYQTSDDATQYSYYLDGEKYIVESYAVDLLNGEKKSVDLQYQINNVVGPYMDKEGIYNNTLISKRTFTSDHILKNPELALVDVDGKIVSNLNGYQPEFFTNVGSGYYNTATHVLYDYNLKEIAYLGAIEPVLYEKYSCFVGRAKGLYGVVDSTGKVTIPFEYQEFYRAYEQDGYLFGVKNNHLYRVNMSTGLETDLGSSYTKINNYLYVLDNNKSYKLEFVKDSLGNTITADSFYVVGTTSSALYNSTIVRFKDDPVSANAYANYEYVNVSSKEVSNYSTYETKGEEKTTNENLGIDYETASTIEVGKNKLYLTRGAGNYFKFTPTKTAYYTLDKLYKNNNVLLAIQKLVKPENVNDLPTYENVTKATEDYGYVAKLEKGETYYFSISSNYTYHGTVYLNLVEEAGEHEKYPAIMELNEDNTFKYYEDGTYISINSKGTGWFEISNPSEFNISFVTGTTTSQKLDTYYSFAQGIPTFDTVDGKRYVELKEFTTYIVKLTKYNYDSDTFEYSLKYSLDELTNEKGKSLYNPYVLKLGDNETAIDGVTYFVYHNDTNSKVRLSAQSDSFFNGNSSLAYIYKEEYKPSLYTYERINNGTVVELAEDEEIYIRTNNSNTNVSSLIINVERISSDIHEYAFTTSTVNNKTYYFCPQTNGMYKISLYNAKANDTLKGYDIYNRLIADLKADAEEDLTFNEYLLANVVYKFTVNGTGTNSVFAIETTTSYNNQYVVESNFNRVYLSGSSSVKFTPKAAGIYSFNVRNTSGNNYTPSTFNIYDGETQITSKTATVDGYYYLYAELEKGVEYTINAYTSTYNNNNYNMSVEKEIGQKYYAPIKLMIGEEFDATEYLKALNSESADIYMKVYFQEPDVEFMVKGFNKYSTSLTTSPSFNIPSSGKLTISGNNYLFHATVSDENLKLGVKLNEDKYEVGKTSYNPIVVTSLDEPIAGTLAQDEYRYYSYKNNTSEVQFVSAKTRTPSTLHYGITYNEFASITEDIYGIAVGETVIIIVGSTTATNYSVEFNVEKASDYAIVDKTYTLVDGEDAQTFNVLFDEVKLVEFKLESEVATATATLTIKEDNVVVGTFNSTEGKIKDSYEFKKNTKYVVEIEGEGEFALTHSFKEYNIKLTNFQLSTDTYKSTNTSTNSTGYLEIKAYEDVTVDFDYEVYCRTTDYMKVYRIDENSSSTLLKTLAGNGSSEINGSYTVKIQKGETLRISYERNYYTASSTNGVKITNLTVDNGKQ